MKRVLVFAAFIMALAFAPAALAQGSHEYAPLVEKDVNYKDWTFNSIKDDKPVNLREFAKQAQGAKKKLLMVVYFAPWCPNWRNEAPVAAKLYDKYKDQGLEIVAVSEYGLRDDVKNFFAPSGPPYTVVSESEKREDRDKTTHFTYRQATGDARRWGSPWNIFLEPAKLNKTGDVVAAKAWVVNGELIEADTEKFIREKLGLKPEEPSMITNGDKKAEEKKP